MKIIEDIRDFWNENIENYVSLYHWHGTSEETDNAYKTRNNQDFNGDKSLETFGQKVGFGVKMALKLALSPVTLAIEAVRLSVKGFLIFPIKSLISYYKQDVQDGDQEEKGEDLTYNYFHYNDCSKVGDRARWWLHAPVQVPIIATSAAVAYTIDGIGKFASKLLASRDDEVIGGYEKI